ncbi:hypothetical protein B1964_10040, partial [Gordonia sp. i37]
MPASAPRTSTRVGETSENIMSQKHFRVIGTAVLPSVALVVATMTAGIAAADDTTTTIPPLITSTTQTTAPATTTPPTTGSDPAPPSTPASTSVSVPPSAPSSSSPAPTPPAGQGTLNLTTKDTAGNPVPGVVIEFAGPAGSQPIPLPASINNYPGSYGITVTDVPAGYRLLGSGGFAVNIVAGQTVSHQFTFTRTDGGHNFGWLQVTKRDRVDGHTLPGAQFAVATCDGQGLGVITTDDEGIASKRVRGGCYTAREIAAPAGYLNDGLTYTFD